MAGKTTEQLLAELLEKVSRLEAAGAKAPTGKTLRELYELDEATWASASWAKGRRADLAAGLRHFGDQSADSITRAEWQHWRDHIRGEEITNRKRKPAPVTLNAEISLWRGIYRRAVLDGNCLSNPLDGLRKVRGAKRHRETEPTTADLRVVRRHCTDRTWAFILLAFRRGFRASEARRLEWKQVDLQRGRVTIYAWQEKTRRTHNLKIPSDVVEALKVIKPELGRFVFPGRGGHAPLAATTLYRDVRAAFDKAGLEAAPGDDRVTFHDLRHGYTSTAARKLPLPVAMRMSRHRSLQAAQRYIHVNERELEEGDRVMEQEATRKPPHSADQDPAQVGHEIIFRANSPTTTKT